MIRSILKLLVKFYSCFSAALHYFSLVQGYPGQCIHPVSCSEYTKQQLESKDSNFRVTYRIISRLLSCGPWSSFRTLLRST